MKRILFSLIFLGLFMSLTLHAGSISINECQTDIYYGNGIMTTRDEAQSSLDSTLKPAILHDIYHGDAATMNKNHHFELVYNYSFKEKFGDTLPAYVLDLMESYEQLGNTSLGWEVFQGITGGLIDLIKGPETLVAEYGVKKATKILVSYGIEKWLAEKIAEKIVDADKELIKGFLADITGTSVGDKHDHDLDIMVKKYTDSIQKGHGVILVTHSQGNLFAVEAAQAIEKGEYGVKAAPWMLDYLYHVSIASPATKFASDKHHWLISLDNDPVAKTPGSVGTNTTNYARYYSYDVSVYAATVQDDPDFMESMEKQLYGMIAEGYWSSGVTPPTYHLNLTHDGKKYYGLAKPDNWDYLQLNFHAFDFYMGKKVYPLHISEIQTISYESLKDPKTKEYNSPSHQKIIDGIKGAIEAHNKNKSQYKIKKHLGCLCKEKYVTMEHIKDANLTRQIAKEKIKNFAGEDKGKIYQVGSQYVRATCGGERIEEVKEGEACLALMGEDTKLGEITGLKAKPEAHAGVVEVKAAWNKPELDYDLVVQWGAGETDIKDTGCPEEHFYVSSEKEIYPGKYPVFVIPKDPTDPIWDDPSIYPHTFTATITTPGKGANAQWTATATIHSRAGQTQFRHIADIKVYRKDDDDDDPKDPDDPDSTPAPSSPILFEPIVPPECPPVTVTLPTVEPRPVHGGSHGDGGPIWLYGGGGGWWGGWGGSGGGGGSSIPVQHDPTCSGDPDCLPSPQQDDPSSDDDSDTPFGTPPPEAGGVPPRDFNETDECSGDYSCYCIPCEYKIIPYLKQIYFGPLQDANYTIYSLEGYRQHTPLYKGQTTHGEGLYDSGEIDIPKRILERFEDDRYYIIEAVGGEDIDANDDFVVDAAPTPNQGKVYAIATGREIKYLGFKVNILTTVSFTLARDSIEGNATTEQIEEKLSDIASRLLRYKLYPDKTQRSITNTDILVWLPTTDQDVLLKSYTKLEKMVEQLYQGQAIYDDAYAYVYGTEEDNSSDPQPLPPIIRSFSGTISESALGGTAVGKIEVLRGGEDVVFGGLSGKGSEKFDLSPTGEISLKADETLDYEQKWLYILKVEAHNSHGNSGKVSVFISIEDVVDAPKFVRLEGGTIEENATAGTIVGTLQYDAGASPIEKIALSGTAKDLFGVDSNGTIRLAEDASLDYETSRYYGFVVQAHNSYGASVPTIIYLYVKDIADAPKITGYTGGYVSENAPAGTVVGAVHLDRGGPSATQARLTGIGAENFTIDTNGTVSVSDDADLDYERYNLYRLTAVLGNAMGEVTYPIFVSIRDWADVPSYVSFEGGNVDENSPIGTEVGRVVYDSGASPVTSMVLSGDDAHYFAIDTQGHITLNAAVDYEQKHAFVVYVIATNAQGSSQRLTLRLFVNDLPEKAAVLDDTVFNNVEENLSVGSRLGSMHILYDGSSEIEVFELSGDGAGDFAVDREGNITIAHSLDFETQPIYNLQIKARNQAGYSREVNLIIRLKNIIDTPPKLKELTASVREDAAIGTEIATVEVESQGDAPVVSFSLSGTDSNLFGIDTNGTIRLADTIDYEQKHVYDLQTKAQNAAGESEPVQVHISVENVPEFVPVLQSATLHIKENSPVSAIVGSVSFVSMGDTPVSSYELNTTEVFEIDQNGTLSAKKILDYESQTQYTLSVRASNQAGISDWVTLTIEVEDALDTVPGLRRTRLALDENATAGTIVGHINIVEGEYNAIQYFKVVPTEWQPNAYAQWPNGYFSIDKNGTVRVESAASLDYETKYSYGAYIVAVNAVGESNRVYVEINLNDIPDTPPHCHGETIEIGPVSKSTLIRSELKRVYCYNGDSRLLSARLEPDSPFEAVVVPGEYVGNDKISIRVKDSLAATDVYEYNLSLSVTNATGESDEHPVHIAIDSNNYTFEMRQGDLNKVLGKINVGDKTVYYARTDNGYFGIDKNGTLSRNNHVNSEGYAPQYAFKVYITYDDWSRKEVSVVVNVQSRVLAQLAVPGWVTKSILNEAKTRAYIINDKPHGNDNSHGLVIVDIEDPSNPRIISSLSTEGKAKDIVLSHNEAYLYLLDSGKGLKVIDISDEENPQVVSSLVFLGDEYQFGAIDLSENGERLLMAHGTYGIEVIDVSDPLSPETIQNIGFLGTVKDFPIGGYADVVSDGTTLYSIDANYGLQVIDISDLEHPVSLYAETLVEGRYSHSAEDIYLHKEEKLISVLSGNDQPMKLYTIDTHGGIHKIKQDYTYDKIELLNTNKAYRADSGVRIYDAYNPIEMTTIFYLDLGLTYGMTLDKEQNIAFVANGTQGLAIVDLTDIQAPIHHEPVITGTTINIAEENLTNFTAGDILGHMPILKTGSAPIMEMWTDLEHFDIDENANISMSNASSLAYNNIGNGVSFGVYAKNEDGHISKKANATVRIIQNPDWSLQFQRPVVKIDSNLSIGSTIANVLQRTSQRALRLLDIYKYEGECSTSAIRDYAPDYSYDYGDILADMCTKSDYFDIDTNGDIIIEQMLSEGNYSVNIFAIDRFGFRGLDNVKIEVVAP